jgi:hypothetical protein
MRREDQFFDSDFEETAARDRISRRDFIKRLGGGIFILMTVPRSFVSPSEAQERRQGGYPGDFNAYLGIGEDGRVSWHKHWRRSWRLG